MGKALEHAPGSSSERSRFLRSDPVDVDADFTGGNGANGEGGEGHERAQKTSGEISSRFANILGYCSVTDAKERRTAGLTLTDPEITVKDMQAWITGKELTPAFSLVREAELIKIARQNGKRPHLRANSK